MSDFLPEPRICPRGPGAPAGGGVHRAIGADAARPPCRPWHEAAGLPVKQCALDHGIAVAQPRSLRLDGKYPEDAAAARDALLAAQADVMVVAAYGLILPQWVLDMPAKGCLNIHASLLPRWRGVAPIHRAIEAGDAETGVTIMQMDAGLDTGDMLLVEKTPSPHRHHSGAARPPGRPGWPHDRGSAGAGGLWRPAARAPACRGRDLRAQDREGRERDRLVFASPCHWPAHSRLRSFPGASTALQGEAIKVWGYEIDSCRAYPMSAAGRFWHQAQRA